MTAVEETTEVPHVVLQLAMLMQAKDSRAWGITEDHGVTYHPTWDEQGLIGQQEYLRDAAFLVDAMRLLRWGPLDERDRARETAARLEEELAAAEAEARDREAFARIAASIGSATVLSYTSVLEGLMLTADWAPPHVVERLTRQRDKAEARIAAALACYGPSPDLPLGVSRRWRSADACLAAVRKELTAERVPS